MATYTIKFPNDTSVVTELVEHIPYEPSAYHWDEGIIVEVPNTENLYFISCGTGMIYRGSDEDSDQLTQLVEDAFCPEMDQFIEACRKQEEMFA